jgi:hypothetical protein
MPPRLNARAIQNTTRRILQPATAHRSLHPIPQTSAMAWAGAGYAATAPTTTTGTSPNETNPKRRGRRKEGGATPGADDARSGNARHRAMQATAGSALVELLDGAGGGAGWSGHG